MDPVFGFFIFIIFSIFILALVSDESSSSIPSSTKLQSLPTKVEMVQQGLEQITTEAVLEMQATTQETKAEYDRIVDAELQRQFKSKIPADIEAIGKEGDTAQIELAFQMKEDAQKVDELFFGQKDSDDEQ